MKTVKLKVGVSFPMVILWDKQCAKLSCFGNFWKCFAESGNCGKTEIYPLSMNGRELYLFKLQKYLFKLENVFDQIAKYICSNWKMYFGESGNCRKTKIYMYKRNLVLVQRKYLLLKEKQFYKFCSPI